MFVAKRGGMPRASNLLLTHGWARGRLFRFWEQSPARLPVQSMAARRRGNAVSTMINPVLPGMAFPRSRLPPDGAAGRTAICGTTLMPGCAGLTNLSGAGATWGGLGPTVHWLGYEHGTIERQGRVLARPFTSNDRPFPRGNPPGTRNTGGDRLLRLRRSRDSLQREVAAYFMEAGATKAADAWPWP